MNEICSESCDRTGSFAAEFRLALAKVDLAIRDTSDWYVPEDHFVPDDNLDTMLDDNENIILLKLKNNDYKGLK